MSGDAYVACVEVAPGIRLDGALDYDMARDNPRDACGLAMLGPMFFAAIGLTFLGASIGALFERSATGLLAVIAFFAVWIMLSGPKPNGPTSTLGSPEPLRSKGLVSSHP